MSPALSELEVACTGCAGTGDRVFGHGELSDDEVDRAARVPCSTAQAGRAVEEVYNAGREHGSRAGHGCGDGDCCAGARKTIRRKKPKSGSRRPHHKSREYSSKLHVVRTPNAKISKGILSSNR